jgi:HK97 family phage major capsid protein
VIGLQDLLARSTGRELALDAGSDLTIGNGSSKPNGFINAAGNGGTASGTANNTFFGPGDIVDLFYSLAAPYRMVGSWQASNTGLAKIRKLADSTGQFIWQPSLIPGQPESVMGRPIFENPAMAAVGSASKSVAFGDFKQYWVRRVSPVRVELSRDFKFQSDQLALKVVERIDGDLIDTAAVKYLVSAVA